MRSKHEDRYTRDSDRTTIDPSLTLKARLHSLILHNSDHTNHLQIGPP